MDRLSMLGKLILAFTLTACYPKYAVKKARVETWAGGLYVVQKGDTVHTIASKKKISAFDLMEVNGIENSSDLKPGQKLYIPEAEVALASAPKSTKKPGSPAGPTFKPQADDAKSIQLGYPVKDGIIFKSFDSNPNRLYEGIAIGAPLGTIVHSAQKGEVIYVGDDDGRYGKIVIIKHEDPFVTIYAHLNQIDVHKGQTVTRLQAVGTVGTTGGVDSPRVYFQVRKHRIPVNPELYLKP